jgi:hypothetical protein
MGIIRYCDICKSQEQVETKSFWIDRKMDGAGSMSDIRETHDLCTSCLVKIYQKTIEALMQKYCNDYNYNQLYYLLGPIMNETTKRFLKGHA